MEKNEKTLVIHPYDYSTDFLEPIYSGIKGATVLRGTYSKDYVRELIEKADRVIMLGHGSPNGLLSVGQFMDCTNGMIIDESMVAALGRKKNNMYIWCHADQFVEKYHLNGFYSGMFISEYREASYYSVYADESAYEVETSNDLFAEVVGKNVLSEAKEIYFRAKADYYLPNSEVNYYNSERLKYR